MFIANTVNTRTAQDRVLSRLGSARRAIVPAVLTSMVMSPFGLPFKAAMLPVNAFGPILGAPTPCGPGFFRDDGVGGGAPPPGGASIVPIPAMRGTRGPASCTSMGSGRRGSGYGCGLGMGICTTLYDFVVVKSYDSTWDLGMGICMEFVRFTGGIL